MPTIDPVAHLRSTYSIDDLVSLLDAEPPFATVLLPAPSEQAHSDERLELRWRNARRDLEAAHWPDDRIEQLDELVAELEHHEADCFVVIQAADGTTHVELLPNALDPQQVAVTVHDAPRLLEVIETRQRTLPHLIVVTDRAGATLTAYDGGRTVGTGTVEGDTEHIHRVQSGGWSHRRYQQRAENTWESNAGAVADAVREMADQHQTVMIAVAGEVRATELLRSELVGQFEDQLVSIDAGSDEGIADEVATSLEDLHHRLVVKVLERLRNEHGLTDADEVRRALDAGRVDTLVVAAPRAGSDDATDRIRAVSSAITAAIASSATVIVAPNTPELSGGVAALTRW